MLEIITLLKGLAVGFIVAIPVGPIGVLCIQRTLDKGRLSGFISGVGAATADAFYGSVSAFGLIIIASFLAEHQLIIRFIGGLFVLYVGIVSLNSKPRELHIQRYQSAGLVTDYFSTLFLTATNPITVISFTAFFATSFFGSSDGSLYSATWLVIGVFIGSTLWWLVLCNGINYVRTRIKNFSTVMVDRVAGMILMFFAVIIFSSIISGLLK